MFYFVIDQTNLMPSEYKESLHGALRTVGWSVSDLDNTFIEDYITHTMPLGKDARIAPVAKMRDTWEVARVYTGPNRTMHLLTIYRAQHIDAINAALHQAATKPAEPAEPADAQPSPATSRKTKAKRRTLPLATIAKPRRNSRPAPKPQAKQVGKVRRSNPPKRNVEKRVPKPKLPVRSRRDTKPTSKRTKSKR